MPSLSQLRAFAVHLLTAAGGALALLALVAATRGWWEAMFMLLGAALVADAIDGPLARRLDVAERLPRWSGDVLDLVVDFLTYVFVPAYAVAASSLVPDVAGVLLGILIVITGALYFADRRTKTEDNHFRGFPALWNVVVFYLFIIKPAPWIAIAAVIVFAVLTFVPIKVVHPFRVVRGRPLSLAALAGWAVLAAIAVAQGLAPDLWVTLALAVIGVYFLAAGLTARPA